MTQAVYDRGFAKLDGVARSLARVLDAIYKCILLNGGSRKCNLP
jgi:hypothetical protein